MSWPPMAASEKGRDIFKLSRDWLSVEEAVAAVGSASCGAISLFIGTTREDQSAGRKVIGLEYEAYEAMVTSELAELCRDVRARWPDVAHICVHHRLGSLITLTALMAPSARANPSARPFLRWVPVGEASVVAAVSSPHRQQGQRAVAHLLDGLKAKVPVWKKEVYEDRGASWKENAECAWASCHGNAAALNH
ncbi:molybdopterin synthase catalytic subunit isoform X1 [Vanacampus margaritifer]